MDAIDGVLVQIKSPEIIFWFHNSSRCTQTKLDRVKGYETNNRQQQIRSTVIDFSWIFKLHLELRASSADKSSEWPLSNWPNRTNWKKILNCEST
jgi:hypothetical protein